jgi:hypothetical protein
MNFIHCANNDYYLDQTTNNGFIPLPSNEAHKPCPCMIYFMLHVVSLGLMDLIWHDLILFHLSTHWLCIGFFFTYFPLYC